MAGYPKVSPLRPLVEAYPGETLRSIRKHAASRTSETISALVGRFIGTWSFVEMMQKQVINAFVDGNWEVVSEAFLARISARSRDEALEQAAKVVLPQHGFGYFSEIIKRTKPVRDRRNQYVHYTWAGGDTELWLAQSDAVVRSKVLEMRYAAERDFTGDQPDLTIDASKVFVFRGEDVEQDIEAADHLALLYWSFFDAYSPSGGSQRLEDVRQHLEQDY